jgi:hypothetical protein
VDGKAITGYSGIKTEAVLAGAEWEEPDAATTRVVVTENLVTVAHARVVRCCNLPFENAACSVCRSAE